ncbi:MAG: tetratricopeptide repeat protein [Chloroflexi bacterium]|nr:MAG: tetratricopeptide repeat protein [Chloroflexota bacterium]
MLGQKQPALEYYKQALSIAREVEDHEGEGKTLRNLGKLYLDQQRYEAALAALLLARDMLGEIQSTYYVESERGITTLRKTVGENVFTTLLANVEPRASYIVEQVLNEET